MAQPVNALGLQGDLLAAVPEEIGVGASVASVQPFDSSVNIFDDMLNRAIQSLDNVSRSEMHANQLIEQYARGEAELHEVMMAQAKAGILVQLAATTINLTTTTFKEITQIQV